MSDNSALLVLTMATELVSPTQWSCPACISALCALFSLCLSAACELRTLCQEVILCQLHTGDSACLLNECDVASSQGKSSLAGSVPPQLSPDGHLENKGSERAVGPAWGPCTQYNLGAPLMERSERPGPRGAASTFRYR
jgi:hypothetical protein